MATVSLDTKNVGDVVKIAVGSSLREFLILHKSRPSSAYQEFENAVLVVQKDVDSARQWHKSNANDYANSDIDAWLNGDYYNSIDASIRAQIAQVRIPYRAGSGTSTTITYGASGLLRKIFLLSMYEIGFDSSAYTPMAEGVKLDYFLSGDSTTQRAKRKATTNLGVSAVWWLRTPSEISSGGNAYIVGFNGDAGNQYTVTNTTFCPRPAFALPSSLLVLDDGTVMGNRPPAITGSDSSLGTLADSFNIDLPSYQVSDPDPNDTVTVEEKING